MTEKIHSHPADKPQIKQPRELGHSSGTDEIYVARRHLCTTTTLAIRKQNVYFFVYQPRDGKDTLNDLILTRFLPTERVKETKIKADPQYVVCVRMRGREVIVDPKFSSLEIQTGLFDFYFRPSRVVCTLQTFVIFGVPRAIRTG